MYGTTRRTSGLRLHHDRDKDDGVADLLLGQVISVVDYRDIPRLERKGMPRVIGTARFVLVRRIIVQNGLEQPELNPDLYGRVPKQIDEAIPTCNLTYIPVGDVKSIAYLFHIDDVQAGKYKPGGIGNAFAVRRERDQHEKLHDLESFLSFCHPCCYSKRMWDAQIAIQEESRKAMSGGEQWDGRTNHLHLKGFNREVCSHYSYLIKDDGAEDCCLEQKFTGKRPQKVLNADLSNEHMRLNQKVEQLRAVEEPALK